MPLGAIGKLRKGINPGKATAKPQSMPANLTDRPPRTGVGTANLISNRRKGGGRAGGYG